MHTPRELLPAAINEYRLVNDNRSIELVTEDYRILVDMM
jgi:hypothetical protein